MFSLHRRHEKNCRFRDKGVRHIKCDCPVWMEGRNQFGSRIRRSLKTRSWSHAQRLIEQIAEGRKPDLTKPAYHSPALSKAVEAYLTECRVRKLAPGTVVSYSNTLAHLIKFFPEARTSAIDLVKLSAFRAARAELITGAGSVKEIQTIRAFFRFCVARKWAGENPASELKPPRVDHLPTMPFTQEEIAEILAACERIDNPNQREIQRARLRARALVLLLLYSGLRISDAVKLERKALDMASGKLLIRMMKTRAPLYVKLPCDALTALAAVPLDQGKHTKYFFWSGNAKLSTAVGSARRTIDCILKLAAIENGHPHRFRDTFSVELLQQGADLRTVQLLLGHHSIRTTEKHYAPYVVSMQKILDEAVAKLNFSDKLHFSERSAPLPDAQPRMHPHKDTLRNAKANVLLFPAGARPKQA